MCPPHTVFTDKHCGALITHPLILLSEKKKKEKKTLEIEDCWFSLQYGLFFLLNVVLIKFRPCLVTTASYKVR